MRPDDPLYDDLSRLNNELVNLQRALAKTNAELQKAHNSLERQVEERTAELRAANEQLRQEIEERRRAEQESQRLRAELAHLNRVSIMGDLAAAIAHESNQPLAAILSHAQAALRFLDGAQPNLDEVREALEDIVANDKHAGNIIRSIRQMTKKERVHREPYNLNAVIGDVLHLVQSEIVLHNVSVTTDLDPQLGTLNGNPVQIQQGILNLVMNALDAMCNQDDDSRCLSLVTRLESGEGVRVSVVDSGPGIDPDIMQTIFESFFISKHGRMGIGLAITRTIIQAHGGRLWAQNNVNQGATFIFTLPVMPALKRGKDNQDRELLIKAAYRFADI